MTLAIIVMDDETTDEAMDEFVSKLKPGLSEALRLGTKKGTGSLAEDLAIHVDGRRVIRIESSKKYAEALDRGTRSRQMWSLINKVVPLKLPGGTTIFRRVSLDSIIKGKWRYPGTPALNFVEKGARLAKANTELPVSFEVRKPITVVGIV